MTRLLPLILLLSGCAVTARGYIHQDGSKTVVRTPEGGELTLRRNRISRVLRFLDGELVHIEGTKSFGRVGLDRWRVLEGVSGLQAVVGQLRPYGLSLVVVDSWSGNSIALEDAVMSEMSPFIGYPVLIEGYFDGQSLRVVHYQVLSRDEH